MWGWGKVRKELSEAESEPEELGGDPDAARRAALASNAADLRARRIKQRMVRRLRKVDAARLSLTVYERDRKDRLRRILGILVRGRLGGQRPLAAIVTFSEWPAAIAARHIDSGGVAPPSAVGVQVTVRIPEVPGRLAGDYERWITFVRLPEHDDQNNVHVSEQRPRSDAYPGSRSFPEE